MTLKMHFSQGASQIQNYLLFIYLLINLFIYFEFKTVLTNIMTFFVFFMV